MFPDCTFYTDEVQSAWWLHQFLVDFVRIKSKLHFRGFTAHSYSPKVLKLLYCSEDGLMSPLLRRSSSKKANCSLMEVCILYCKMFSKKTQGLTFLLRMTLREAFRNSLQTKINAYKLWSLQSVLSQRVNKTIHKLPFLKNEECIIYSIGAAQDGPWLDRECMADLIFVGTQIMKLVQIFANLLIIIQPFL